MRVGRDQKGFTLVEIMMVVIIIGILAVLAIPRYEKYTIESKLSEVAVAVGEIKTGMEKYYNSHGYQYISISPMVDNSYLERVLRIDLGGQRNFMFSIDTSVQNVGADGTAHTGYRVVAMLTSSGLKNDYNSSDELDRVVFYFPKELNPNANDPAWKKGWNDDDFFMPGHADTPGLPPPP